MKSISKLLSLIIIIILFTGSMGLCLADLELDEYEIVYHASGSMIIGGGGKADIPFYVTSPNSHMLSFEGSVVNNDMDFYLIDNTNFISFYNGSSYDTVWQYSNLKYFKNDYIINDTGNYAFVISNDLPSDQIWYSITVFKHVSDDSCFCDCNCTCIDTNGTDPLINSISGYSFFGLFVISLIIVCIIGRKKKLQS